MTKVTIFCFNIFLFKKLLKMSFLMNFYEKRDKRLNLRPFVVGEKVIIFVVVAVVVVVVR